METRSAIITTVPNISTGNTIKHEGDLFVIGNIGSKARLTIINGSLTVGGNIEDWVSIKVVSTVKMLPNAHPIKGITGIQECLIGYNDTLIGKVNIENRIFTNDMLVKLENNKYKILPISSKYASMGASMFGLKVNTTGRVTATVDQIEYQGKEILIDGNKVYVDGEEARPKMPSKIIVCGTLGQEVRIDSVDSIEIKNNTGENCTLISHHGEVMAQNIGANSDIYADKKISIANTNFGCVLKSVNDGLSAGDIGGNSTVEVHTQVEVQDIGESSLIKTNMDGVKARNIGENANISACGDIHIEGTCPVSATLQSSSGRIYKEKFESETKPTVLATLSLLAPSVDSVISMSIDDDNDAHLTAGVN